MTIIGGTPIHSNHLFLIGFHFRWRFWWDATRLTRGVVCGLVVNIVDALILAWGNAPHGHSHGPPPPPPVAAPGTQPTKQPVPRCIPSL